MYVCSFCQILVSSHVLLCKIKLSKIYIFSINTESYDSESVFYSDKPSNYDQLFWTRLSRSFGFTAPLMRWNV